jgi:hypothetical protein
MLAGSTEPSALSDWERSFVPPRGTIGEPTRVDLSATTKLANAWEYQRSIMAFRSLEEVPTPTLRELRDVLPEVSARLGRHVEALRSAVTTVPLEALTRPFGEMARYVTLITAAVSIGELGRRLGEMEQVVKAMAEVRSLASSQVAGALLAATFRQRRDEWLAATRAMSSITKATAHRTYLRIIALGEPVIPLLIADLQEHPNRNWHTALCVLTGTNPLRPEDAGNGAAIAAAWKAWQEKRRQQR